MSDFEQKTKQHIERLTTISRAKGFLGREFLTWLWYLAEIEEGKVTLPTGAGETDESIGLWVDDHVVLESHGGASRENAMKGGNPSHSEEATVALATGKTVKSLKLGLHLPEIGDCTATLKADDLAPRGLRLPDFKNAEAADKANEAAVGLRLRSTERFVSILDQLFKRFQRERTAETWETNELKRIREWIKGRREKQSPILH